MAYDYDGLDEDELEELREEREEREYARKRAGELMAEFERRLIEKLFHPPSIYMDPAQAPEHSWLVEGFLSRGSLVILGGTSKCGKSCLATALAMAVARGEPFLGRPTKRSAVLWCAFEEAVHERREILRLFGETPENFYATHTGFLIDNDFGLRALRHWADRLEAPLIVVDPLFGATRANLADGRGARDALMGLKRLANETMSTIVLLHHVNKDTSAGLTRERFAESNQLLATASMDILMDSRPRPDGSREIRLQARGRGAHANHTWLLRSDDPTSFELVAEGEPGTEKSDLKSAMLCEALRATQEPAGVEELAERTGFAPQTVRNLLAALQSEGRIVAAGREGRRNLYALAAA